MFYSVKMLICEASLLFFLYWCKTKFFLFVGNFHLYVKLVVNPGVCHLSHGQSNMNVPAVKQMTVFLTYLSTHNQCILPDWFHQIWGPAFDIYLLYVCYLLIVSKTAYGYFVNDMQSVEDLAAWIKYDGCLCVLALYV